MPGELPAVLLRRGGWRTTVPASRHFILAPAKSFRSTEMALSLFLRQRIHPLVRFPLLLARYSMAALILFFRHQTESRQYSSLPRRMGPSPAGMAGRRRFLPWITMIKALRMVRSIRAPRLQKTKASDTCTLRISEPDVLKC